MKRNENYLELIPLHNPKYKSVTDETGNVTILQENKGIFYFLTQKLFGKPRISQIHLDEIGSYIWPLIDGRKNILQIADSVKEHYGEKAEPLYHRLATYFSTMEQYGFIVMKKEE